MKVCPNCKAKIQEEARFCLYCMTSFEKKQAIDPPKEHRKRGLPILIVGLIFVLAAVSLLIFIPKNTTSDATPPASSDEAGAIPTVSSSDAVETPISATNATASSTQTTVTSPAPHNATVTYQYTLGTMDNIGYYGVHFPEDTVVITKVDYIEESGVYVIPQTIDGKKVAAIMPYAFSDPAVCATVKSVTLPSTVRTVWESAFEDCVNLTDLYLESAVIEINETAFPSASRRNGLLTIHCQRDCRNFDFYYYRNIVSKYDAEYEEWKG